MASYVVRHFYKSKNLCLKIFNPAILPKVSTSQRHYTSALFVSGNKAHKTFAYLSPELDVDDRLTDIEKFQNELNLRGYNIDVQDLKKTWEYYQYVNSNKHTLEKKIAELSNQVQDINKKDSPSNEDKQKVDALITQVRLVKQDLKVVKEAIWDLEETIIPRILKLPNEVDERTPSETFITLKTVGEKPNLTDNEKANHLDIGKNLNLLEYRNPIQCYLRNEAVFFELGVLASAGKILNENGNVRVAGPDFARSIVVEGTGMDHESSAETFILKNTDDVEKDYLINRLHLVGGSSLPALLAIYTKQVIKPKDFPIKIFTTGRQYSPFSNTSPSQGLFSLCQASTAHALILIKEKNSEEYKNEFQNLIETTAKIYDELGCHYRVVIRPVKDLAPAESIRVSFQMWSIYSNQYVEVGYVSACGDYFSKRLLIAYHASKKTGFPAAITGTLLSVPRVLGCLLEENPKKFILPEKISGFI